MAAPAGQWWKARAAAARRPGASELLPQGNEGAGVAGIVAIIKALAERDAIDQLGARIEAPALLIARRADGAALEALLAIPAAIQRKRLHQAVLIAAPECVLGQ